MPRSGRWLAAGLCIAAAAGAAGWFVVAQGDATAPVARAAIQGPVLEPFPAGQARFTARFDDADISGSAGLTPLARRVTGRIATLPSANGAPGIRHQWPGTHARARFSGDAVILAFDDARNRYRLTLEGSDAGGLLITRPGRQAVHLAGLGPGTHQLRLDKISESLSGADDFPDFFVPAPGQALAPPDPKARQIEIIGDSDAVGYGNLSPGRDCTADEVFLLTDTQEAFGPRVARHFDAGFHVIAASGIGVVRNIDGSDPGTTMLDLYPRRLINDPAPVQPDGWQPQVVVFALGSNDFTMPLGDDEAWPDQRALQRDFETRYAAFIRMVRSRYPEAFFVLVAMKDYGKNYLRAHHNVLAELQSGGERNLAMTVLPKMEKTGCHWHPSDRDHRMLADGIVELIGERPGLWSD